MFLISADIWDLKQKFLLRLYAEHLRNCTPRMQWRKRLRPDTATVLRAVEIEAEAILLAKAVDGIYDSDPKVNPEAVKYDEISIEEVVDKKLAAMDLTASIMCLEQKMPMLVFGLEEENSIVNAVHGKFSGTKVTV